MMRRIGFGLAAVALCAAACGTPAAQMPQGGGDSPGGGGPQIEPGTQFTMAAHSDATISGSDVHVSFDSVAADSRCKKGQTCIWEGDATVNMTVGGAALALHTSKRVKPNAGTVKGYQVQLVQLSETADTATVLVTKS